MRTVGIILVLTALLSLVIIMGIYLAMMDEEYRQRQRMEQYYEDKEKEERSLSNENPVL